MRRLPARPPAEKYQRAAEKPKFFGKREKTRARATGSGGNMDSADETGGADAPSRPSGLAPRAEKEPVRLNKALADAGVCSRRKADELILAGLVSVNDAAAVPGTRIFPGRDRVSVRGRPVLPIGAGEREGHVYLLLHKPAQVVSTVSDPEGRPTVLDCLPSDMRRKRLYPVGRLDYFSEGLLLLTDDGELTHRLTHPRYHLPKIYELRVREAPTPAMLQTMRRGMTLREGERLAPVDVDVIGQPGASALLRLTLHQGLNRQIRRMCRDLGLTILTLRRVELGPLRLGDLEKGRARALTAREVAELRRAAGLP